MSEPGANLAPISTESRDSRYDAVDMQMLFQAHAILDQKIDWIIATLNWMAQVFQGLQAMTSVMPGKAGKMARDMMAQMQVNMSPTEDQMQYPAKMGESSGDTNTK